MTALTRKTTKDKRPTEGQIQTTKPVHIPTTLHYEMKITAAKRGQPLGDFMKYLFTRMQDLEGAKLNERVGL